MSGHDDELREALAEFRAIAKDTAKLTRDVHVRERRCDEAWITSIEMMLAKRRSDWLRAEMDVEAAYQEVAPYRAQVKALSDRRNAAYERLDKAKRRWFTLEEIGTRS